MDISGEPVGFFDLYDFNAENRSAGIGIIVHHPLRRAGIGSKAIQAFFAEWIAQLGLKTVYADVEINNISSRLFFEKNGFKKTGLTQQIERFVWHVEN
jgi:diamine N-acetyltransferase